MFKNYLITAWKVFLRRKFFTFINLFGISLTLAVIMVASSIVESYLYPQGPEKMSRHYRLIDRLTLTNDERTNTYGGGLGYKFIEDNIERLKTPELVSINTGFSTVALYLQDKTLNKSFRRTDANYWRVLDFNFVAGRPFDQDEFKSGKHVAVINQLLAKELFSGASAVGRSIRINNQSFTIVGVVSNVSIVERNAFADIWVPYTTLPSSAYQQETRGNWQAILYHSNSQLLSQIQSEYVHLLKHDLMLENTDGMTTAFSGAWDKIETFSARLFASEYSYDPGKITLQLVVLTLLLLFMLLPSINMINLNVSRIMERASEIGVRKAFGASTRQLVSQFLVENLLITFVGGLIGLALSQGILQVIESAGLIPFAEFSLNWRVLLWGSGMILVFGLLSGAYPAFKMSRLHPVKALKGGA